MSSVLTFARRHKWKLAGLTVVGGTSYVIWKALRGLPVRQLVSLMMQARSQSNQVENVLQGGEGTRLLNACLRDLRNELATLVDVQEKQAAAKALEKHQVQERLAAFKELSVASLTRSVAAVYVVCVAQLLLHAQIFELVRLQRGHNLHEEAQRRFLSAVQRLSGGEAGPLREVVRRVEGAVRRVLAEREQNEACDAAGIELLFQQIREHVEGARRGEGKVREEQSWLVDICRGLLSELRGGKDKEGAGELGWMMGGGAEGLGVRMEREVVGQLGVLSGEMREVVESALFEEALAAALHAAWALLAAHVNAKLFPPPNPPNPAPDPAAPGPLPGELPHQPPDAERAHPDPAPAPARAPAGVEGGAGVGGAGRGVPLLKMVPVVSNLFMAILHPDRQHANPFTALVLSLPEAAALFECLFAAAPPGPGPSNPPF